MLLLPVLTVLAALVGQTTDAPIRKTETVATVATGSYFWYGHELTAPFRIELSYSSSGTDTTWYGLVINDLPVQLPVRRELSVVQGTARREAILNDVFNARRMQETDGRSYLQRCADRLRQFSDDIDRTEINGSNLLVYWRGESVPETFTMMAPGSVRPSPGLVLRQEAGKLARMLSDGWTVVGAGGVQAAFSPLNSATLRNEMADLRQQRQPSSRLLNSHIAQYFRQTRSREQLLHGDE